MSKGHMVATVAIMAALQQPILASESLWTAVTLARDGSMGVGVHHSRGKAVALAAVDCRRVARRINDCGSSLSQFSKAGWLRCYARIKVFWSPVEHLPRRRQKQSEGKVWCAHNTTRRRRHADQLPRSTSERCLHNQAVGKSSCRTLPARRTSTPSHEAQFGAQGF